MDDQTPEQPAGRWPDASLRPDDDAPPIEWARFYRDHCGWIVCPTAGPADVRAYAESLALKAAADYAVDHTGSVNGEVPEEVAADLWDDAREIAEATLGRPIGYVYKAWSAKVVVAADVTDEMLRLAWEPLEHSRGPMSRADERGVAVMPGRSSMGLPVCLVDVDPRHGGDVTGEWGEALPGPKASTPNGGLHTLVIATGKETASADLGPGVDVVAGGGTMIPLPSGSATPGRRWLRWEAPVVAPEALRRRGRKSAHKAQAAGEGADPASPGGDEHDPGHVAALVRGEVGDGERNRTAGAIVGVLARPRSCPEDFVAACLETLAEEMAGRDASSAEVREECDRWQRLLTRGPRDADFAAEVLEVWYRTRNTAAKRWKTTPRKFASSVWRVCDRREEGRAGAEDLGVGPPVSAWPSRALGRRPVAPPPDTAKVDDAPDRSQPPPEAQAPPGERVDPEAVPYPPPPPEAAEAAVAASRVAAPAWRGGIDPRTYAHGLGAIYTDDDLRRDLEREPIQIDAVMPVVDFNSGQWRVKNNPHTSATPLWHGWGEHLGRALGGLSPGDFRVIGAAAAGAGKTWFECWLAHGLALQTASRLLGLKGYEERPLVLPVWLSEMPKKGELYLRAAAAHLGFDPKCVTAGTRAHDAPGVRSMADRYGMTAEQVVAKAHGLERLHGSDERYPLCVARYHVIKALRLTDLPRRSKRVGVLMDHRAGPALIDHLADAVDLYRDELAALAGVGADRVLPLVMIDPGQRFAGDGESEKRAIDALFSAIVEVLCNEVGAAVLATSDTTKAATREVNIDAFLSKEGPALAADIFAGSQAIMHHADVLAVCAERPTPESPLRTRQWVRVLKNREGVPPLAFPFSWEMHLGRFTPDAPEPLREPVQPDDGQRRGGRGGRFERQPAPPPVVPPGVRLPPLRRGSRAGELQD